MRRSFGIRALPVLLAATLSAGLTAACSGESGGSAASGQKPDPASSASPAPSNTVPTEPPVTPSATPSTTARPSGPAYPGLTGDELMAKVSAALLGASSLHVKGSMTDKGTTVKVNLVMARNGDASGTVQTTNGLLDLRVTGSTLYLAGDDTYWERNGLKPADLRGKWIKTSSTTQSFASMRAFISIQGWSQLLTPTGTLKRVPGRAVGGRQTVGLLDASASVPASLYVSATGAPVPLLLQSADGKTNLRFSSWNAPVTVKAPPKASVLEP